MAKKKEVKTGKKQESDQEFLARIAKMQKQSEIDTNAELAKYSNSKEVIQFKEEAKKQGTKYKEIEECFKIAKEFESNPPIMISVNVNGKNVKQYYEDKNIEKKAEMLKKNNVSFLKAVHHISTYGITFKTFGKVYVKRGSQKILLPETNEQADFLLKDGDILVTEKASAISEFREESKESENDTTQIIVYPKSEIKVNISEKTTNPAPAFMVPSQVSESIKRNSKSTVTTQKLLSVELLAGIFSINIERGGKNVNSFIKIASSYPKISFKSSSAMYGKIIEGMLSKMQKENPVVAEMYKKTSISKDISSAKSKTCTQISAYIELCKDGSIVIPTTGNVIVHEGIKKETSKPIGTSGKPMKITITRNQLYETDTGVKPDARASRIVGFPIITYFNLIKSKKELEKSLQDQSKINSKEEAKKIIDEAESMLKDAQEIGDKELIEMAKTRLKTNKEFASGKMQEISGTEKEMLKKALKTTEQQIEKLQPEVETDFPPYSSP